MRDVLRASGLLTGRRDGGGIALTSLLQPAHRATLTAVLAGFTSGFLLLRRDSYVTVGGRLPWRNCGDHRLLRCVRYALELLCCVAAILVAAGHGGCCAPHHLILFPQFVEWIECT